MSDNTIRQRQGFAMGQTSPGYGNQPKVEGGRNPGYAKGGSVKNSSGYGSHSTHKSHGHGVGVKHNPGGVGGGGAPIGKKQSVSGTSGGSTGKFGSGMPGGKGSSLGKW